MSGNQEEVSILRDKIDIQGVFQNLTYQAFTMDLRDSFSKTERDSVVDNLISLSGEEAVVERSEFASILGRVLISLASADQVTQINQIVDAYPDQIFDNREIAIFLTGTYGRHLLYSRANKLEDRRQLEGYFSRLRIASDSHDFQGALKPWDLGLDMLSAEADEIGASIERHVDELIYLGTQQKAQALILLFTHQKSEWYQTNPEKTTTVVTDTFSKLFAEYGAQVGRLVSGEDGGEIVEIVSRQLFESESLDALRSFIAWTRDYLVSNN